jgi:hypothetical protein
MKRHRVTHLTALTALTLALSLAMAAAHAGGGVAAAAESAAKDAEVKLDAPPASKGLRVAVLTVVNPTGEADADKIMEDVLRERFKDFDRSKAIFLMPSDVERLLADANALDRASRITDRWSRTGNLDSTAIGGLDSLLIADAVLCIKIGEWETKRYHNIGEGQSYSMVGLHFALFGISNKKKLWTKDVREQRLAREIDLSSATVGYDDTGRIQTPNANDPPRIHDVASDLVRDALKKFPTK